LVPKIFKSLGRLKLLAPQSTWYAMKKSPSVLVKLAAISLMALLVACGNTNKSPTTQSSATTNKNSAIKPGGIYLYKGGDGNFGTLKVLVQEGDMVDVQLFKNRFPTAPNSIDPKTLEVAVKHEVLSVQGFQNWQPQLLLEQPVTPAELADRP
jgi:hypothetical protein